MGFARLFFYLFLFSIPFGTRILVYQFTTGFHEYEAVFLYASDIFLILFLVTFWFSQPTSSKQRGSFAPAAKARSVLGVILRPSKLRLRMRFSGVWLRPKSLLIIFLLFAGVAIFWSWNGGLAIYNFGRLVLLVVMALATERILRDGIVKLESIFAIIAGSAVLQSLIGFLQFLKQSSLGLGFLGESVLGPFIGGTAKIIVEGAPIMRAYGTFPHPNILAAFLLLGLFGCYHHFFRIFNSGMLNPKQYQNINDRNLKPFGIWNLFGAWCLVFGISVIMLGLVLTFSRTAWALAALSSIWLIGSWLMSKEHRKKAILLLFILLLIFNSLFLILKDFIFPRAQIFAGEPAVSYRLAYNQLGLDLVKNHPFGIGIGNQVLYSVKNGVYEKFGMDQAWQWQPIHNIYLLMASEIGLFGLMSFLLSMAILLFKNPNDQNSKSFGIWNLFSAWCLDIGISKLMLASILLFGMVDHFLWTLQPGRLMLWLVIGILMSVSRAHSTMDSVYPSEG